MGEQYNEYSGKQQSCAGESQLIPAPPADSGVDPDACMMVRLSVLCNKSSSNTRTARAHHGQKDTI